MDITCKIINILPVESFTSSKNGQTYNRHGFIGETQEQYPKKIHFQCLGDEKWEKLGIVVGEDFQISFDLSSREWKERWYTQVDVWRAVRISTAPAQSVPQAQPIAATEPAFPSQTTNDDIPF